MLRCFQINILTEIRLLKYGQTWPFWHVSEAVSLSIYWVENTAAYQMKAYNQIFESVVYYFMFFVIFGAKNRNPKCDFVTKNIDWIELNWIAFNCIELHWTAFNWIALNLFEARINREHVYWFRYSIEI